MNDRFKCRVWDKENKCMHYPSRYSNFAIVNGTVVKIESYPTANSAYLGKRIAWEFDDAVIMQCTGLKDKNGKLIYEGDIVTYEWLAPISKVWRKDGKHIVEWQDGFTVIGNIAGYDVEHGKSRNVEIIGNIYENKELLESEG